MERSGREGGGWGEALAGSFFSHLDFWYKTHHHPCFSTVFSVFSSNNRTTLFLFLGNILADILAQRLRDILQASGNINISAEYIVFTFLIQFTVHDKEIQIQKSNLRQQKVMKYSVPGEKRRGGGGRRSEV